MDKLFRDQQMLGIIEKMDNINQFKLEHPEHSFMGHMPVFKLNRSNTKCRIVYSSNLCKKISNQDLTVSYNQAGTSPKSKTFFFIITF